MELKIDNRIILALAEVAGSAERDLDNIFLFHKENDAPIYFATNGTVAMRIEEVSPEFNFSETVSLNLPVILKKILKFNKKEENSDLNCCFVEKKEQRVHVTFFNNLKTYHLNYELPEIPKFEKMPDVFDIESADKKAIAFNPSEAQKLNKALARLGFEYAPTFLLDKDFKMCGTAENENFIVQYIMMGCRTDEE